MFLTYIEGKYTYAHANNIWHLFLIALHNFVRLLVIYLLFLRMNLIFYYPASTYVRCLPTHPVRVCEKLHGSNS